MADFSSSRQAQIAFKNLLGKSQTDIIKGIVNEPYGIAFDVSSKNVWMDTISDTASSSVLSGSAVLVEGTLEAVPGSNNHAFFTKWPTLAPSGSDKKTGLPFVYGSGSLSGISAGDRIHSLIPDSYGLSYKSIPYSGTTEIPELDDRIWVYQYNSGIFYQENTTFALPTKIMVYAYIGSKLESFASTQQNIRLTAYGTNSYHATQSNPLISSYLNNYLFLVDFQNTNTSNTLTLNIEDGFGNGIGTYSILKYGASGSTTLVPGDIIGAVGLTAGPIYYLTFDDGAFQFFSKDPSQSPSSYTNVSYTNNTSGGVDKGTSFDNVLIQDVFTDLFYKEQLGNITSVGLESTSGIINGIELGDRITISDKYTFSWSLSNSANFQVNSSTIDDITVVSSPITNWGYGGNIVTNTDNSVPYPYYFGATISSLIPRSRDFRVSLKRNNGTIISKTINVDWMWKVYYGSSSYSSFSRVRDRYGNQRPFS